jgi:hypothetical protein
MFSQYFSDRFSQYIFKWFSQYFSDWFSQYFSDKFSQYFSNRFSQYFPDSFSQYFSDRFSQCFCIKNIDIKLLDNLAADGCLQYYTGVNGVIQSFNFFNGNGLMLSNTDYSVCVR